MSLAYFRPVRFANCPLNIHSFKKNNNNKNQNKHNLFDILHSVDDKALATSGVSYDVGSTYIFTARTKDRDKMQTKELFLYPYLKKYWNIVIVHIWIQLD